MKVFLSWSGERSRLVADALRAWLPSVIQAVEPWMSDADIGKGAKWAFEIAEKLEDSKFGIVCLTSDNLSAPWILFEAGALSKTKDARVCTFLLDVQASAVEPPLGQFQATKREKEDVRKLLRDICTRVTDVGEKAPPDDVLDDTFEHFWSRLEGQLDAVPAAPPAQGPSRPADDVLDEILTAVRRLERERGAAIRQGIEEFLQPDVSPFVRDQLLGYTGRTGTIGDLARLTRTGAEAPPATVFSEKVTQVKQQTKERQKGDE